MRRLPKEKEENVRRVVITPTVEPEPLMEILFAMDREDIGFADTMRPRSGNPAQGAQLGLCREDWIQATIAGSKLRETFTEEGLCSLVGREDRGA